MALILSTVVEKQIVFHLSIVAFIYYFLISKIVQPVPSYWHGCQTGMCAILGFWIAAIPAAMTVFGLLAEAQ
jgi:hypothetical protein